MTTCAECGGFIDRTLPKPLPDGYECMWSEAMCGHALYCQACYDAGGWLCDGCDSATGACQQERGCPGSEPVIPPGVVEP